MTAPLQRSPALRCIAIHNSSTLHTSCLERLQGPVMLTSFVASQTVLSTRFAAALAQRAPHLQVNAAMAGAFARVPDLPGLGSAGQGDGVAVGFGCYSGRGSVTTAHEVSVA